MAHSRARIFISYRREDTAGHVLALLPALRRHFGDRVFKDTDNIPPGEDFVRFIKNELDSCSVLLAVIGRDWLNVQDPRLQSRRLDNPDDFLRIEVSTALRSEHIRVIPVLVERSTMPSAADLPLDLAELSHRNALELSDARWESDVHLLIHAIQRAFAVTVEPTEAASQRPELQDLQKRRAREITAHLAAAQEAFDAQQYEETLRSCEKALLLDPTGIEALELLDRARKSIDEQKIETWLKEAGQSLRRGDIGGASDFIDQALSIDPASATALGLRKEMLAVRRERERDRERARAAVAATERARTSLDEEDLDGAVRHADDALALEPQSADAQDVRSRAVAALDERRRQREARRRAQQTVTDPREERSTGAHQGALLPLGPEEERRARERQEQERRAQEAEARVRAEAARVAEEQHLAEAHAREHAEAERERERASEARELHSVPELWSIRRYGALGAAAVIFASGIGLWQYQRLSEPTSMRGTNQVSSARVPAGTTDPAPSAGGVGRGASPGPAAAPTTQLKEESKLGNTSVAPSSAKSPDPGSRRPSPSAGGVERGASPGPAATPTQPEEVGTLEDTSVATNPAKPPDPGSSRPLLGVKALELKKNFEEGVAASQAGNHDEAIARFEAAATIEPDCHDCYYNIGVVQMRKKDYDKAEASFKKVIELKPDHVASYSALAALYNGQRKFDRALEMSKKASELSGGGNVDAVYNQGVILWNAGKMAEAKARFEAALKMNANHAEAHYFLGMANMNEGKMAEAATEFETYLKLAPEGPNAAAAKSMLLSKILKR